MKFQRPTIRLEIFEIFMPDKTIMWDLFKKHHYLTDVLNKAARCFIVKWESKIIAFSSVLPMPNGNPSLRNAWRGHRLVVLSDYQGLGVGTAVSECVYELFVREGKRVFAKTANRRLGVYRNNSPLWRKTSQNMKNSKGTIARVLAGKNGAIQYNPILLARTCYSHEYVGRAAANGGVK